MFKDREKRKELLIYSCIIIAQVIVLLYWAHVKTNYFIDDLYSLGYASSFTGEGDTARYITRSPEFGFNEWISNAEFKKYLILNDNEKLIHTSFLNAVSKMLRGRMYFGLLNIAESIAGYSYVTARPAIVLNIILFVITEIMLILLMKKMNMDKKMSYLSLIMFGCSTYVISAAEYIRFYILVILFLILMLMCLYDFWQTDTWRKASISALGMGVIAYFSYKNSELTIPFFGGLVLFLIIISFFAKKRKQLIISFGMLLAGTLYIFLSTDFVDVLLYPENYTSQTAGVELSASNHIDTATVDTFKNYLTWARELFETHYFGSYRLVFMFLGAATIYLILAAEKKRNEWFHIDWKRISLNNVRPMVCYSLIAWAVIYEMAIHLGHGVYICKLVLLLIAIFGVLDILGIAPEYRKYIERLKKITKIPLDANAGFILIVFGAVVVYTVFTAAAGYQGAWRYYVFGFISSTVVMWYLADRIMKFNVLKKYNKAIFRILAVFVIISALMPFKERKIEYMFEDEKSFLSAVKNNNDMDVVMFIGVDQYGDPSRHETYDCVNLMSENSDIYIVNVEDYKYRNVDFPDEFVLWCHATSDVTQELDDLVAHGYEIEELGTDHCSRACVCRKKN